MKIIYNVTVSIDHDVQAEWLTWMKVDHIPAVLATGCFLEAKLSKILAEESGGLAYSIQYLCQDADTLEMYQEKHAPELQNIHHAKYLGKYAAFRTILRVEEVFKK
ncbi:DUF4286 domain-containing protein [Putridiphycobacter roseus]|uniref:DUF4286 domain-containing protein n=1 Tax=Putridiphycobacter roseus TaxID=2219161 RepID=A0A2W1NCC6_9FLAO|nr:DUF4286 family protein [Putridiphycobacter roseus]PZE17015.1 DUF4286 domain-containing protein [Putridiphycobacter roseus]